MRPLLSSRVVFFLLALLYLSVLSSPVNAQYCGDNFCDPGESGWCSDCDTVGSYCGDSFCDPGESDWCSDCDVKPFCGDGFCDAGETVANCAKDCGCEQKFLGTYSCSGNDRQREKVKSDCTNEWVKLETCAYGCNAATATCNSQPALTCEEKFLDSYRCLGDDRQREKQLSGCSKQWVTLETCPYGCQQVWASPTLPVSCNSPPDDGGGWFVSCAPAVSCASLGCGQFDSCGSFCGSCPFPPPVVLPPAVPPVTPPPVVPPLAPELVLPKPLQLIAIKFPLQPLFLRALNFPDSDCVRPGESALLAVKVQNTARTALKGVKFSASVPELGIRASDGPVKLTTKDKLTRFLQLDIPKSAKENTYYLRFTVSNNKFSRAVHRSFVVDSSC